ncbi:unnamed protein product [Closterium sp. NIES-54]
MRQPPCLHPHFSLSHPPPPLRHFLFLSSLSSQLCSPPLPPCSPAPVQSPVPPSSLAIASPDRALAPLARKARGATGARTPERPAPLREGSTGGAAAGGSRGSPSRTCRHARRRTLRRDATRATQAPIA